MSFMAVQIQMQLIMILQQLLMMVVVCMLRLNFQIVNNISCHASNDGSIDLVVSGGLTPYTFIWSNGLFTEDINNLPPGTYTINVSDALGQISSAPPYY